MDIKIQIAIITATVTMLGWAVSHILIGIRSEREKKAEIKLKYIERQIDELYGPIFNSIHQIFNTWTVKHNIIDNEKTRISDQDKERLESYFGERYFFPLHQEIKLILKNKLHLVKGGEIPQSFMDYLEHSTQEIIQKDIWNDLQIDTTFLTGKRWPRDFYERVKEDLDSLLASYEHFMKKIE